MVFLKAKSDNFHFHKNDVTWPLSANGPADWLYIIKMSYQVLKQTCFLYVGCEQFLISQVQTWQDWKELMFQEAACKEIGFRWPGASGFCCRGSEFCH